MKISWSQEALIDLADLRAFIEADDPNAARRIVLAITNALNVDLSDNPALGHPGRIPGTRELVIPKTSVVVPYRLQHATLEILRVYHQARRWPDHF
jgi:toxin ParE1/3/4